MLPLNRQWKMRFTTVPVVSSAQNGSGTAYSIVEQYDAYLNRTSVTDERGIVVSGAHVEPEGEHFFIGSHS